MVPDNFLSLLSSKNKNIYLASILQTFKVYETGSILGIDKKVIADDLVYFLDTNSYLYDVEDEEDEEANPKNKRELANYILRRMEECGWIYVDVTNDYEEVLNFTDVAITICEALLKAYPQYEYGDDVPMDYVNPNEYQGYIYRIYSLLSQKDNVEYALTFSLIYSDTKQLIRAIRRIDARMKEYIKSVIDNSEIKDLMEKLIFYKTDIYDSSYMKLKVSDNINRYRLYIITRLKAMQNNDVIVKAISNNYLPVSRTIEETESKAIRNLDEVMDAFNAIESFIQEIDNKNRTYVNSTIGKIKFLLSEEDNVIGKLNTILKHIKSNAQNGKIDKAMRLVEELYDFRSQKSFSEDSLYSPRGSYARNYNQVLDDMGLESFEMTPEFMDQFRTSYNEDDIHSFMDIYMVDDEMKASSILDYDSDENIVMMMIYCVILAVDKNYIVEICDEVIEHKKFRIRDFIIKRRG